MSDEQVQAVAPTASVSIPKKPGLLTTPAGKMFAIVAGLGILGIVAGIAVAIVLYVFDGQEAQGPEGELQQPPAASLEATGSAKAATPADEIPNAELFTFRDIFEPLVRAASSPGTGTGSTGVTDTITPTDRNTLYLDGVVTEGGVMKAQLRYNGTAYTLAAGGAIPDSPWQVLRVQATSVVMLYGDVQVTLAVGQGITK
ncbi:MAG: hypothetical protein ACYCXZ_07980 [Coriobacteriia bacterium]